LVVFDWFIEEEEEEEEEGVWESYKY